VHVSFLKILSLPTRGVTIVTSATTTRLIAEKLPSSNSRKRTRAKSILKPKLLPKEVFDVPFRRNQCNQKAIEA
jgi:hypothetical protein